MYVLQYDDILRFATFDNRGTALALDNGNDGVPIQRILRAIERIAGGRRLKIKPE
jgi:hypothetical protein